MNGRTSLDRPGEGKSLLQLSDGRAREAQDEQFPAWRSILLLDQPADAVHQEVRLAGTGTGEDEHARVDRLVDDRLLVGCQLRHERRGGHQEQPGRLSALIVLAGRLGLILLVIVTGFLCQSLPEVVELVEGESLLEPFDVVGDVDE